MAFTKLFQVVEIEEKRIKVWRTYRTEKECESYLESDDLSDLMCDVVFTILPVWTNASESSIEEMLD